MTTPILMYHSIGEIVPRGFRPWVVTPGRFRAQVRSLSDAGYTAATVRDLVAQRSMRDRPGATVLARRVVLTFDDGYADFLTQAAPVLQELGMSGTLFVCPGLLGGSFNGLPVLDWAMLKEVQAAGFEIGGHSMTHPALDRLPPESAMSEIRECKLRLEDRLGTAVTSFAYPFGFYATQTRQAVIAAGHTASCAVGYGFSPENDDPFALRRMIARQSDKRVDRLPLDAWLYRARSRAWALARHMWTEVDGYAE
jgi:peptidoglycan/xylan/chitin deacetylase (PgdA/CDA1 family)